MKPNAILLTLWFAIALGAAGGSTGAAPAAPAQKTDPFAENACVQCHRDLPGRHSEIVDKEWKQSVHYAASVGCDGCHGGDPSVKAAQFRESDTQKLAELMKRASHQEFNGDFLVAQKGTQLVTAARGRSVSYLCGKCHAKIKEYHLGSPHGEFGDPTCVYCHATATEPVASAPGAPRTNATAHRMTHQIVHPTPEIIDTRNRDEQGRCSPCHKAATMQAVARIKGILLKSEQQIKDSEKLYAQLEEWGYHNLELEKEQKHHASEIQSQLRQIFHSFNMRDINNFAGEVQTAADNTAATYELIERLRVTQKQQTWIGFCAVVLLLTFAGLLIYYKHRFLDHDHTPDPLAKAATGQDSRMLDASRERESADETISKF